MASVQNAPVRLHLISTAQRMKFSIKDFQVRDPIVLWKWWSLKKKPFTSFKPYDFNKIIKNNFNKKTIKKTTLLKVARLKPFY